jgi:hypothetical protein
MSGYYPENNGTILRIGFDVDGVLSHFSPSYQRVIAEITGKDLFQPGDANNPPCWDWDLMRGYTKEERAAAFEHIARHPSFWYDCGPLVGVHELQQSRILTDTHHEIYFITNRAGLRVKYQTESWLTRWLELYADVYPTVVVNGYRTKGLVAKSLLLDAYIDDNSDNVMDCLKEAPSCNTRMLNASYNQTLPSPEELAKKAGHDLDRLSAIGKEVVLKPFREALEKCDRSRVESVGEFLRAIGVARATAAH